MRTSLSVVIIILSSFILRSQTSVYSGIVYNVTQEINCNSVVPGFNNDYFIAGGRNIISIDDYGNILSSLFHNDYSLNISSVKSTIDSSFIYSGSYYNYSISRNNLFVMKRNVYNDELFMKEIDFGKNIYFYSACACSDSGFAVCCSYITTGTKSDIAVIKFDKNGTVIWSNTYSSSGINDDLFPSDMIQASDSSFLISGWSSSSSDKGLLIKLDNSGNVIWTKEISENSSHNGIGIGISEKNDSILYSFKGYNHHGFIKFDLSGNYLNSFYFNSCYFSTTFPLKMHIIDSTSFYFSTDNWAISYVFLVDSTGLTTLETFLRNNDLYKTNDNGFIIFGNGPLVFSKNSKTIDQNHIGIIRTDSLFNTENCAGYIQKDTVFNTLLVDIGNIILEVNPLSYISNDINLSIDSLYVTYEPGCVSGSGIISDKTDDQEIIISPNPSDGKISVLSTNELTISELTIFDKIGKRVFNLSEQNKNYVELDLEFLSEGVYLISVIDKSGQRHLKKIVIY